MSQEQTKEKVAQNILKNIDYDQVVSKKIFQKFLEQKKQGPSQLKEEQLKENSYEEQRMQTITEEEASRLKISPEIPRNNKMLQDNNKQRSSAQEYDHFPQPRGQCQLPSPSPQKKNENQQRREVDEEEEQRKELYTSGDGELVSQSELIPGNYFSLNQKDNEQLAFGDQRNQQLNYKEDQRIIQRPFQDNPLQNPNVYSRPPARNSQEESNNSWNEPSDKQFPNNQHYFQSNSIPISSDHSNFEGGDDRYNQRFQDHSKDTNIRRNNNEESYGNNMNGERNDQFEKQKRMGENRNMENPMQGADMRRTPFPHPYSVNERPYSNSNEDPQRMYSNDMRRGYPNNQPREYPPHPPNYGFDNYNDNWRGPQQNRPPYEGIQQRGPPNPEARMVDYIHKLESRCREYEIRLERSIFNQGDGRDQQSKAVIFQLEGELSDMRERVYDLQRREDGLAQENDKLRQKISYEQLLRTKAEEDARQQQINLDEIRDQIMEAKREIARKDDESIYLKQQIDSLRAKFSNQQAQEDVSVQQLRVERDNLVKEIQQQQQNGKQIIELQDKVAQLQLENNRIGIEYDTFKSNQFDFQGQMEEQKQELYTTKHHLIEKAQKEALLQRQLDNAYQEIKQLKTLLNRAEAQLLSGNDQYVPERPFIPSRDRISSQSSPQQIENNDRAQSFEEASQFQPLNSRNKVNKDLKEISSPQIQQKVENQADWKSFRNKNTVTPSNFLSWDVQDAPKKAQNNLNQNQSCNIIPNNKQVQKKQDYIDNLYQNVQSQMERDSEYVNQQYLLQQQQSQSKSQQYESQQSIHEDRRGGRNIGQEYSQIYNDYMSDKFTSQPQQQQQYQQQQQGSRNKLDQSMQIQNIESNLMMLNVEKEKLSNEFKKLDESKIKSGTNIKRKIQVEQELTLIDNNISNLKLKLRELNALHPY